MNSRELRHFDILAARNAYANGQNITQVLRDQKNVDINSSEIIETAYDLQAGTYIQLFELNPVKATSYASELASLLDRYIKPQDSLMDIGTGELTTLSLLSQQIVNRPSKIFAFDISWSRLYKGLSFAEATMANCYDRLIPFVADISEIPLPDKSINITTSSHALEPNGSRLCELMTELFRVTSDMVILFEPYYEIASEEGRRRMDRLGYIRDIEGVIEKLGGALVQKTRISSISNPLNPTFCFAIRPPSFQSEKCTLDLDSSDVFAVPGTSYHLKRLDEFYFSNETGLCFPILKSIPILKSSAAILASALSD